MRQPPENSELPDPQDEDVRRADAVEPEGDRARVEPEPAPDDDYVPL